MLLKFEYDLNRATASYHGRPFYDCIRYKYEIGSAAGACHGAQFQNDIEISVSYAKPLLFSISASTEQHGFLRVLGIFTNGPKQQRDCILFVKWLDGAFAHNARSGRSIYKPHPPVSRCIGYMRDTKGYSVKKSGYAFVPVSEGNVLAPVWLQPDPADRKRERFIAMKNNDAGDWDQTPS